MAVSHLITKGFDSVPFLITQGLGAYGGDAPTPEVQQPTGGWQTLSRDFGQPQTKEARQRERERLGIIPAQQRAIDRAAVKIAPSIPEGGLVDGPTVMATPAFDKLLSIVQPTEGQVIALVQAILDRIAWMMAEQEEEEAIVRLMMEMD